MVKLSVYLPWPPSKLNPNARVHWAQLAKEKAAYRQACRALCKEAGFATGLFHPAEEPRLSLESVPPTRARRDLDNCLSSMKAGIDGMSDALQVNDCRFAIGLLLDALQGVIYADDAQAVAQGSIVGGTVDGGGISFICLPAAGRMKAFLDALAPPTQSETA